MNWHTVIALFGGGFDPPHLGHREAVRGLFKNPGVKRVLILPSAIPVHKSTWATVQDRTEMARLNFLTPTHDPLPSEVELDLRELVRAQQQPQRPTYTFDTLQEFKKLALPVAFVIGVDQLENLPTWHRFPEVLTLSHWIVLDRKQKGKSVPQILQPWQASGLITPGRESDSWRIQKSPYFMTWVSTEAPAISSTQIRETLARTGAPPAETLLPEVFAYLKAQKLYGIQ